MITQNHFWVFCDKMRRTKQGEILWQELMEFAQPISQDNFVKHTDLTEFLDGQTLSEYLADDPTSQFLITLHDVTILQSKGFECFFKLSERSIS